MFRNCLHYNQEYLSIISYVLLNGMWAKNVEQIKLCVLSVCMVKDICMVNHSVVFLDERVGESGVGRPLETHGVHLLEAQCDLCNRNISSKLLIT